MRYNASELKQMAVVSGGKFCTKEGILSLKEKEGKLWNKTDVLTERWCRLVDNLFFYFKTRDVTSDPYGVLVLESSHVRYVTDEYQGCAFILEFDGENKSTYFLAPSKSEAQEWIKALENASYAKLKQKYELLIKQQNSPAEEVKQDSNSNSLSPIPLQSPVRETRSANSSPMLPRRKQSPAEYITLSDTEEDRRITKKKHKKRNIARNPLRSDSTLPILEVSLSCSEVALPKAIENKKQLHIRVVSSVPKVLSHDSAYSPVFNTESVKASSSVQFLSTLSFYQTNLITPHTILRFHLCQIKESRGIFSHGFASCVVRDLFHITKPLVLNIQSKDTFIGKLHLHVVRETVSKQLTKTSSEQVLTTALLASGNVTTKTSVDSSYGDIGQNPNLKSLYCQAICRTYRFRTRQNDSISVQEIMLETRLSFHIPELYLKLLIDNETKCIATLSSMKFGPDRLQISKKRSIEFRQNLLEQYNEAIKGIVERSRNYSFKTSIQKVHKELEFAPTNLHLQRMRVQHADCMSVSMIADNSGCHSSDAGGVHDIYTFGAAAAHCLKFKQGGLLSLLSPDKTKRDFSWLFEISEQSSNATQIEELPVTLPAIKKEIATHISTLETLLTAGKELNSVPNRNSMESIINLLNDKICQLLSLMDNKALCTAIHVLQNPSHATRSTSSLITATNGMLTVSGIQWEETKGFLKSKLADIVKKCHLMVSAADDLLSLNQGSTPLPTFDEILDDLIELGRRLKTATDIALQGQVVHSMQSPQESSEIIYRRDVVFSQALSACICGVVTNLFTSLQQGSMKEDFAQHGMLVQFESLLSTYKNELGMLEDFIVGVYDLRKVTFICERAAEQVGSNMDHLLPTLQGTRNNLIVRLHIDPSIFATLPESLKSGEGFKVVPIIFNVGINEEQTLADKIGSNTLQDYTNNDAFRILSNHCKNVRRHVRQPEMLDRCMKRLNDAIQSRKTKNVEILQLAAQACKLVNGVRLTSCKSAKDRTAMSVTLEQAQVLIDHYDMSPDIYQNVVAIMRTEGTRRENTRKNVGVQKYAFTPIQLMTFPKQYRPPEGTYGKTQK